MAKWAKRPHFRVWGSKSRAMLLGIALEVFLKGGNRNKDSEYSTTVVIVELVLIKVASMSFPNDEPLPPSTQIPSEASHSKGPQP